MSNSGLYPIARLGALIIACSITAACGSSVQMLAEREPASGPCNVTVYQTVRQATAVGEIEELCIINGTTSGSFRHTIANAIDMHKDRACDCGATEVYVESRSDTGISVATVTLVGFKFLEPAD